MIEMPIIVLIILILGCTVLPILSGYVMFWIGFLHCTTRFKKELGVGKNAR